MYMYLYIISKKCQKLSLISPVMVTFQQGSLRMKSVKGLFNRLYAFIVNFYFQVNELLSEEERPQIFEALKRYQSYDILYS